MINRQYFVDDSSKEPLSLYTENIAFLGIFRQENVFLP